MRSAGAVLGVQRVGHELAALLGEPPHLLLRRPQLRDVEHRPHEPRPPAVHILLDLALFGDHGPDGPVRPDDPVLQPRHHAALLACPGDGRQQAVAVVRVRQLQQALRRDGAVRGGRDAEDAEHLGAPRDDPRRQVQHVAAEAGDALGARQGGERVRALLLASPPAGHVLHHRHAPGAAVDEGGRDDHGDPAAVPVAEGQVELLDDPAAEAAARRGDLAHLLLGPEGVGPVRPDQLLLRVADHAAEARATRG